MGGRRKKGIKEKLPGGHKDNNRQDTASGKQGHVGLTATGGHGTEGTGEKKGLMDKISRCSRFSYVIWRVPFSLFTCESMD